MHDGDADPDKAPARPTARAAARRASAVAEAPAAVVETTVSPFHCLYQDALDFHTRSHLRLAQSEAEAARLARAALVLYLASAEALIHQAAAELGRPDLARLLCDPIRPLPLADAWRLLPSVVPDAERAPALDDPDAPPWPQLAELLALRTAWAYPGPEHERRAYYRARPDDPGTFDPIDPRDAPPGLPAEALVYPRTGLPRDPYALRPRHLDTARSVLDAAIAALDRRLGGALTRNARHRREPVRVLGPR
jgi:hypothetical protein